MEWHKISRKRRIKKYLQRCNVHSEKDSGDKEDFRDKEQGFRDKEKSAKGSSIITILFSEIPNKCMAEDIYYLFKKHVGIIEVVIPSRRNKDKLTKGS